MYSALEQFGVLDVQRVEHLLEFRAVDDFARELTGESDGEHVGKVLAVQHLLLEHELREGFVGG